MKNLKGQAAMEYLMTYGWAILAIVLVIAALIFLNPFRRRRCACSSRLALPATSRRHSSMRTRAGT